MTSAAARRFAVAPVPRVASFVPKTVAWQAVRCYASGSSLDKVEVYERIKQLLSGFDKVGFGALVASPGGVSGSARSDFWVLFQAELSRGCPGFPARAVRCVCRITTRLTNLISPRSTTPAT